MHFNDLFGIDLDLILGQFQVSDPLFKRELRVTFEDYQIYRVRIGQTPSNLTYDRGVMVTYGSPFGLDVAAEVVNGNGKGPAGPGRTFDSDDHKNVLLRLSQALGPVRVGGFGYFGKAEILGTRNRFRYLGVDGTLDAGRAFQLNFQYLERQDDNPLFLRNGAKKVKTKGGFVEAIWAVKGEMGRPFVTFLYNWVDGPPEFSELDYETATLSFSYLLRRNLRLVPEATRDLKLKGTRLQLGFVSAF